MNKETWKILPENWKDGVRKYAEFKGEPKPGDFKKIAAESLYIYGRLKASRVSSRYSRDKTCGHSSAMLK